MCPWNKPCDVQKLYRYRPPSIDAGSVIRLASIGEVVSFAGAVDLEVADGALGIYCSKSRRVSVVDQSYVA